MSRLFDHLEDETPPTTGAEIGNALAGVLQELKQSNAAIQQSNRALGLLIGKAIADALKAVESREIVIENKPPQPVRKWEFRIERDKNGLLKTITATAKD